MHYAARPKKHYADSWALNRLAPRPSLRAPSTVTEPGHSNVWMPGWKSDVCVSASWKPSHGFATWHVSWCTSYAHACHSRSKTLSASKTSNFGFWRKHVPWQSLNSPFFSVRTGLPHLYDRATLCTSPRIAKKFIFISLVIFSRTRTSGHPTNKAENYTPFLNYPEFYYSDIFFKLLEMKKF